MLSKTLKKDKTNTTIISDNIAHEINKIKQQEGVEILLFGSPTATHALMELDLIDGYWLFINPIVLGKGIPLFQDIQEQTKLKLTSSKIFDCGVVEVSYFK